MKKVTIAILIDALGWEVVKDIPFLDDIVTERRAIKTILGYSSAAVPSILSGKHPSEHGHWSYFYYSPQSSPFRWTKLISWAPDNRYSRRLVKELCHRFNGFGEYFSLYRVPLKYLPIFDHCEKRNIFGPGGLNGAASIFDLLAARGTPFFSTTGTLRDTAIMERVVPSLASGRVRFYFLYFGELDGLMHTWGTRSQQVRDKAMFYDSLIRTLFDRARRAYDVIDLIVFSDHGMVDTIETHDVRAEVDSLGLSFAEDYVAFYDSTLARFWFFTQRARSEITELLESLPFGQLLSELEMKELGVYFGDKRFGELFFLLEDGHLIVPSFMGDRAPAAMHGFHPANKENDGMFMNNSSYADGVSSILDIFQVMERSAGIA